jgi:hypothetical protein
MRRTGAEAERMTRCHLGAVVPRHQQQEEVPHRAHLGAVQERPKLVARQLRAGLQMQVVVQKLQGVQT